VATQNTLSLLYVAILFRFCRYEGRPLTENAKLRTTSSSTDKEEFWREMDEAMQGIPGNEDALNGGDMNGHVDREREE